jgi:CelD/BcsL family acetyltransferase involved in cellulose biosynthesis
MSTLLRSPAEEGASTARGDLRCEVWCGRDGFEARAEELEALLTATAAPVTAQLPWLTAWLRAFPAAQPWVVAVRDEHGVLQAAAPLARHRHWWGSELVLIGDGVSDYARLPARDELAASSLAHGLASHLSDLRSPWTLALRQLPAEDRVAVRLAARLRHARLLPGRGSPQRHITERDVSAYVSKNHRKQARNKRNRLERDGHPPRFELLRDPGRIRAELDEVLAVCREREREMLGRSPLDEPGREFFFREMVHRLTESGSIELAVLRAGDEIAAYSLNLLDGGAYRTYNVHHAPRWAAYSPGRILDAEIVKRVVEDPRFDTLDLMMGLEPYKLRGANHIEPSSELLAWSTPMVGAAAFAAPRLRGRLELAGEADERAARALEALRTIRTRVQHRLAAGRS